MSVVGRHQQPQRNSVQGLKTWSGDYFREWNDILKETDVDDFRSIGAPKGQIDKLVLTLSQKKIGNAFLRPFVSNNQTAKNVTMQVYKPSLFLRISAAVSLCAVMIFFQIPVALLSYHILSREVGIGLALGFCLLFSLFAQWLSADRTEVFYILVFTYGAIIGGNIINFEDNKA